MERPIVRESRFRNVFSKTWKKELFYTNLKVNLSGGEDLFKANSSFFAVPWTTAGGGVAVISLKNVGKASDSQPLLSGHTDGITTLDFSPFDDHILATGSRDNTVKIWKIPQEGVTAHITTPQSTLSLQKKVINVQYHPVAENLLFTSTAVDFSAKLWDVEKSADVISLVGHTDVVGSVAWNVGHNAQLVATACKDKKLRVYDPRASPKPVQECLAHDGVQGFRTVWADSNDFNYILTVGFSKGSERSASLWDPRKLDPALHSSLITGIPGSSALFPFYDPATNIVFFSGKGDIITFYEMDRFPATLHHLNKAQFSTTHSTLCALPKRVCDPGACEIDRFLRLTNNVVETVSFVVPRKTQATHFQSDLFPPAHSGKAGLSGQSWLSGSNAPLPTVSVRPAHLTEDAPPPLSSSASSVNLSNPNSPVTSPLTSPLTSPVLSSSSVATHSGPMLLEVKGWFYGTYEPRHFSVSNQTLICFPSKDSAEAVFTIPIANVQDIKLDPAIGGRFSIVTPTITYNVEAYNQTERDKWLQAMSKNKSTPAQTAQEIHSGNLRQLVGGFFWDTNEERKFVVSGGVLNAYTVIAGLADTSTAVESIHLDKLIGVHATEAVFDIPGFSFQISTATRVLHLLANTLEERNKWLKVLGKASPSGSSFVPGSGAGGGSTFVSRSTFISNAARAGYTPGNLGGSGPVSPTTTTTEAPTSPPPGALDPATEEDTDDEPPPTQIVMSGWGQRRTAGLMGMLGMWGKCYISLIGEDLFVFKDMRSATPDLRAQLGNVVSVRKSAQPQQANQSEFQIELPGNVIHYFRATTPDDCERWVEAMESSRKRAANISKLMALVSEGEFDEEDPKTHKNLIEPHLLKTGQQKVLMQVRGKRRVRVCTVALSPSSLNTYNAFVLDVGSHLYVWLGEKASRVTRAKAIDLANRIKREERSSRAELVQLEEGKTDMSNEAFWKALGGKPNPSDKAVAQSASDQDKEEEQVIIYWVGSDPNSKSAQIQVVDECLNRLPKKEILNTTGVFVVDTNTEVFCWIGKASGARARKHGLRIALGLAEQRKHVVVERVLEFGEPNLFKEKFANYPGMLPISTTRVEAKRNIAVSRIELKVQELVQRMTKLPTSIQASDPLTEKIPGESRMTIWRIEEFEKVAVPKDQYGQFFMGESYIIHYAYTNAPGGKDIHILFYFIGRDCPTNDKGTAAYLVVELDETLGSNSTQVRVEQDKEPIQFLAIFKGKYVVHSGKYAEYNANTPKLYDIRGKDALHSHAVDTERKSTSLHSACAFVLRTPSTTFIWKGKHSLPHHLQTAQATASLISPSSPSLVSEGEELASFWEGLEGGKGPYHALAASPSAPPRLFVCTNASGRVDVEREERYSQEDLANDVVVLLDDCVSSIYIWLGKRSSHVVRKVAMEVAIEFAKQCKTAGHPRNVFVVHAFHEPNQFKAHFRSWSTFKYPKPKTPTDYAEWPPQPVEEVLQHYLREVYSYQELLSDTLPPGVDVKKLESYLSDEEFEKVFHMTRQDFEKVPQWKRENLKREVYMY